MSTQKKFLKAEYRIKTDYPVPASKVLMHLLSLEQFSNQEQKLRHYNNVCAPLLEHDAYEKFLAYVIPDYSTELMCKVKQKYDPPANKAICTSASCFHKATRQISEEDLTYCKGRESRRVSEKEILYVLGRMTSAIWNAPDKVKVFSYSYFFGTGQKAKSFAQTYFEKTKKKLQRNKLAHILQVLCKHNLLHKLPRRNGQDACRYLLGIANPYYPFACIPVVPENEDGETHTGRKLARLQSMVENYETVIRELRSESEVKDRTIATLQQELETCKLLAEKLGAVLDEVDPAQNSTSAPEHSSSSASAPEVPAEQSETIQMSVFEEMCSIIDSFGKDG